MRLLATSVGERDGRVRLRGEFERGAERFDVWFDFPAEHAGLVADGPEPFAALALLPAMQAHEPLEIVPPLSARQLQGLARVREVWHRWRPDFAPVPIVATPRADARPPGPHVAAFFSLGVDSFYTALKHLRFGAEPLPLSHLVFTTGLERPLESSEGAAETEAVVRAVAAELGAGVVAVATNLRSRFPLDWAAEYHGAGLAATALALGGGCGTVLVPATHAWEQIKPWGGSPTTDEHYATGWTRILFDGGEADRGEKVEAIAAHAVALARLRVCTANRAGAGNCGRCLKCVRTMVMLAAAGRLGASGSFPRTLPAGIERHLARDYESYAREIVALARRTGAAPGLADTVERHLRTVERRAHLDGWVSGTVLEPPVRAARAVTGAVTTALARARQRLQRAESRATGTRGSTRHAASPDAQA
jgi:hypothetical protein